MPNVLRRLLTRHAWIHCWHVTGHDQEPYRCPYGVDTVPWTQTVEHRVCCVCGKTRDVTLERDLGHDGP
jgi:hypothetical protein